MNAKTSHLMKATRAKEHLDNLHSELKTYYATKACEFQRKDDLPNDQYCIRINVKDPPERLSLIAGDFFGTLRASLDHLVWALCTINLGKYAQHTQFPIMENPDSFKGQMTGIQAGAKAIIESLQPYHGKDKATIEANLLWRLNKLCNIDKHRRIPIHGSVTEFRLPVGIKPIFDPPPNDNVMRFPLSMKSQVVLYDTVIFSAVFGDSHEGVECNESDMEAMYKFVTEDVLPKFDGFF